MKGREKMKKARWYGMAFVLGAVLSSTAVFANNTVTSTITVQDDTLAATISPTTLSFNPQIGEFSSKELHIENTGQVAFYPSVAFTNFSNTSEVEERGKSINSTDKMIFRAGNQHLDIEVPVAYPKGKLAVNVGETYNLPLSVGAGLSIPKGTNKNLTFDIEVTLDRVMEVVENLKATANGSSVELTWDPFNIEGATASQYRISAFKYNVETERYERYRSSKVSATNSYTWTGVDEGADYRFEVIPNMGTTYRAKSLSMVDVNVPVVAVGEEEVITPPAENVQNVQYTLDGTNVTLTWDEYVGAERYRVYIARKSSSSSTWGSSMPYSVPGDGKTTTYTRNLNYAGSDYKVTIVPYLKGTTDFSKESTPIEFTIE